MASARKGCLGVQFRNGGGLVPPAAVKLGPELPNVLSALEFGARLSHLWRGPVQDPGWFHCGGFLFRQNRLFPLRCVFQPAVGSAGAKGGLRKAPQHLLKATQNQIWMARVISDRCQKD